MKADTLKKLYRIKISFEKLLNLKFEDILTYDSSDFMEESFFNLNFQLTESKNKNLYDEIVDVIQDIFKCNLKEDWNLEISSRSIYLKNIFEEIEKTIINILFEITYNKKSFKNIKMRNLATIFLFFPKYCALCLFLNFYERYSNSNVSKNVISNSFLEYIKNINLQHLCFNFLKLNSTSNLKEECIKNLIDELETIKNSMDSKF